MPHYKVSNSTLEQLKENPFRLEREIQTLFEANLTTVMGLELVKSEFSIKNRRIDTLAFDPEAQAFIIIEYKRDRNISVVDQGFTYLGLMLENKADFIIEYNETLKKGLKRNQVDWSQTRVAFVSTSFTDNQKEATNFKDIAIELWEVKRFENDTVSITPIRKSPSAESIKPIAQKNKGYQAVQEEIKVYTEEDHLEGKPEELVELYEDYKTAILNLDDHAEVEPGKTSIAFKAEIGVICNIALQQKGLKIWVNKRKGELDDPKYLARDVSAIGHWGNGDYEIKVSDTKHLEYIMSLVKQVLQ